MLVKARKVLAAADRHDAVSCAAVGFLAVGTCVEFGLGWALIVVGVVLAAVAWKGLR